MKNIDLAYVQRLIDDGVSERVDTEYKSLIQVGNSIQKKEFLADVSSFANTMGGDLIYGIEEEHGVPTKILPLRIADVDLEKRRLDNLIRDGIRPRISYEIEVINVEAGKIFVIRIDRSWNTPHRVVFEGWDRFFGRNSGGKYPLDVDQLRESFARSQGATERLRAFRTDRIIAIGNNAMPFPLAQGGRIIVHCIPVDAFVSPRRYDVLRYEHDTIKLRPLVDLSGYFTRITLEGIMSVAGQPWSSYIHLYRNGIIGGCR
jgi:Schlafen, AlbA_2